MDGQKPSISRGFQANLENNANTMGTNEPGCSSGMCGEFDEVKPENGLFGDIKDLLVGYCEFASKKSLLTESVSQWLQERWGKSVPNVTPCKVPTLPTSDERPKPIYCWWDRQHHNIKSPTAPAPASISSGTTSTSDTSSRDDAVFAELKESGAYDYFVRCPHLNIHTEAPDYQKNIKEQQQENVNTASSSDSGRSKLNLSLTPGSSSKVNQLVVSPQIEIPASLLLKCQPRPLGSSTPESDDKTPSEEEVPHIILSIDLNDVMSNDGRRSRSLDRRPRPECKMRRSASTDSTSTDIIEKYVDSSESSEESKSCCRLQAKLKKFFTSEDNLLHKVAWRGHVFYCSCLYYWLRACKSYNKFGEGIRRMNRENR